MIIQESKNVYKLIKCARRYQICLVLKEFKTENEAVDALYKMLQEDCKSIRIEHR